MRILELIWSNIGPDHVQMTKVNFRLKVSTYGTEQLGG